MSKDLSKKNSSLGRQNFVGFYPRMLAHNIDLLILLPFFYLISYFIPQNALLFSLCSLLYIIYHSIFEASGWKGSFGKKLQRIRVESGTGQKKLAFIQVLLRNAFKVLSTALFFSGFIMVIFDPKKRGLHDRMAGTVVIFGEN